MHKNSLHSQVKKVLYGASGSKEEADIKSRIIELTEQFTNAAGAMQGENRERIASMLMDEIGELIEHAPARAAKVLSVLNKTPAMSEHIQKRKQLAVDVVRNANDKKQGIEAALALAGDMPPNNATLERVLIAVLDVLPEVKEKAGWKASIAARVAELANPGWEVRQEANTLKEQFLSQTPTALQPKNQHPRVSDTPPSAGRG